MLSRYLRDRECGKRVRKAEVDVEAITRLESLVQAHIKCAKMKMIEVRQVECRSRGGWYRNELAHLRELHAMFLRFAEDNSEELQEYRDAAVAAIAAAAKRV